MQHSIHRFQQFALARSPRAQIQSQGQISRMNEIVGFAPQSASRITRSFCRPALNSTILLNSSKQQWGCIVDIADTRQGQNAKVAT